MARRKKNDIAEKEEVLQVFTSIMRGEMTDEPLRRVPSGEEHPVSPPKIAERCKAAELLGKQYGLFEKKEEKATPKADIVQEIREIGRAHV